MLLIYHQRSGHLTTQTPPPFAGIPVTKIFGEEYLIADCYAGSPEGKNDPDKQSLKAIGPLPQGVYTIGQSFDHARLGQCCMRLNPNPANHMYGRGDFLIHADSIRHPGAASEGCIVVVNTPDIKGGLIGRRRIDKLAGEKEGERKLMVVE